MDLSKDELEPALSAWGHWVAFAAPLEVAAPISLGWLEALWSRGDDALPWTLVHDLGFLLLHGTSFRFASQGNLGAWAEGEREARLAYEGRVVGRFAIDRSVLELHVAISALQGELRDEAIVHALAGLLAPLRRVPSRRAGNAAHLRAVRQAGTLPLGPPPESWAAWAYNDLSLCAEALPHGQLLGDEYVWEVAHLAELRDEGARLALRQVFGVKASLGKISAGLLASLKRLAGEVPRDVDEADAYPAGGIDAIATRGVIENLVRTELVYVGEVLDLPDAATAPTENARAASTPRGASRSDLFDVRYAEGDLLYYTRDESPVLDAHRRLLVVIDRAAELRFKVAGLAAQNLVLIHGVLLAALDDLTSILGPRGWSARIVHRHAGAHCPVAEEESALLRIALEADIAHRRVSLETAGDWALGAGGRAIVFSIGPRVQDESVSRALWIRVGDETWSLEDGAVKSGPRSVAIDMRGSPDAPPPRLDRIAVDALVTSILAGARASDLLSR